MLVEFGKTFTWRPAIFPPKSAVVPYRKKHWKPDTDFKYRHRRVYIRDDVDGVDVFFSCDNFIGFYQVVNGFAIFEWTVLSSWIHIYLLYLVFCCLQQVSDMHSHLLYPVFILICLGLIFNSTGGQLWLQKHSFYACTPILNFSALIHRTTSTENLPTDGQR